MAAELGGCSTACTQRRTTMLGWRRALTVLHSNNGKNVAKKGAKACPPAAAARTGMASPACSSNMASYSACGAR